MVEPWLGWALTTLLNFPLSWPPQVLLLLSYSRPYRCSLWTLQSCSRNTHHDFTDHAWDMLPQNWISWWAILDAWQSWESRGLPHGSLLCSLDSGLKWHHIPEPPSVFSWDRNIENIGIRIKPLTSLSEEKLHLSWKLLHFYLLCPTHLKYYKELHLAHVVRGMLCVSLLWHNVQTLCASYVTML